MKINFYSVENPRKGYGWEDESGCNRCGSLSSAYVRVSVPPISFKLCGGCIEQCKKIIDGVFIKSFSKVR